MKKNIARLLLLLCVNGSIYADPTLSETLLDTLRPSLKSEALTQELRKTEQLAQLTTQKRERAELEKRIIELKKEIFNHKVVGSEKRKRYLRALMVILGSAGAVGLTSWGAYNKFKKQPNTTPNSTTGEKSVDQGSLGKGSPEQPDPAANLGGWGTPIGDPATPTPLTLDKRRQERIDQLTPGQITRLKSRFYSSKPENHQAIDAQAIDAQAIDAQAIDALLDEWETHNRHNTDSATFSMPALHEDHFSPRAAQTPAGGTRSPDGARSPAGQPVSPVPFPSA